MQTPAGHTIDAGRPLHARGLVGDHLQPVLPLSLRAHGHRRLSHHRDDRRRGGRLASAAQQRATCTPASCSPWRCGWLPSSRRSRLLSATCTGCNTLEHQPAKVAAMEGHFETQRGAPLILFGWPDMAARGDAACHRDPQAGQPDPGARSRMPTIRGLKDFPRDQRPTNVPLVFWSFRIMVGMGLLMIGLGAGQPGAALGRQALHARPFLAWAVAMAPSGHDRRHRGLDRHRSRAASPSPSMA